MRGLVFGILGWIVLLTGCHSGKVDWNQAMQQKMHRYGSYSKSSFSPYFAKAQLNQPKELAFLVFKQTKEFEVYARKTDQDSWHYIKTFPIYAASGDIGPKLRTGDYQVPEGIYHVVGLNPRSRFDLSMQLDYPNTFDLQEAQIDHRSNLGGNIFIHGDHRSVGCIALGNDAIHQIFPLVYSIGEKHVTVIIAPTDLRKQPIVANREHLPWVPTLYAQLQQELRQFH